ATLSSAVAWNDRLILLFFGYHMVTLPLSGSSLQDTRIFFILWKSRVSIHLCQGMTQEKRQIKRGKRCQDYELPFWEQEKLEEHWGVSGPRRDIRSLLE